MQRSSHLSSTHTSFHIQLQLHVSATHQFPWGKKSHSYTTQCDRWGKTHQGHLHEECVCVSVYVWTIRFICHHNSFASINTETLHIMLFSLTRWLQPKASCNHTILRAGQFKINPKQNWCTHSSSGFSAHDRW